MLVEIKVTHEVDAVKTAKLEALGFPCIEIDLSGTYRSLADGRFDRKGVRKLLIERVGFEKKWICIPNRRKYEDELRERLRLAQKESVRAALVIREQQRAVEEARQRAVHDNQLRLEERHRRLSDARPHQ